MALEVRRHRRVDDVAPEDVGAENARLRKMYIEERLKAEIALEALQKSSEAISLARDSKAGCATARRVDSCGVRSVRHQ